MRTIWGLHHSGGLSLVDEGAIVIGWPEAGDLTSLTEDREAFKQRLRDRYPTKGGSWIANAADQLLRFRYLMEIGDLVVHPQKADRTIAIGRITGGYAHVPAADARYPNRRSVEWLHNGIPRDVFSQACLYELGSALSVFQVSTHASEVLSAPGRAPIADTSAPDVAGAVVAAPAEKDEPTAEQIEELTADFILRTLKTDLQGQLFAEFCGRLMQALGYSTRVSPPGADQGVDIVASADPLGVKAPLLKVQCKSSASASGSEQIQALNCALGPEDVGVFIAVGGFTAPARQVAADMPGMRLIGPTKLVELILEHYPGLPDEAKTDIPLRRVWMPDRPNAEA